MTMNEYRCVVTSLYPDGTEHTSMQGHYILAETLEEALATLAQQHPGERYAGRVWRENLPGPASRMVHVLLAEKKGEEEADCECTGQVFETRAAVQGALDARPDETCSSVVGLLVPASWTLEDVEVAAKAMADAYSAGISSERAY